MRLRCLLEDSKDLLFLDKDLRRPVPPARLRYRVSQRFDAASFIDVGRAAVQNVLMALKETAPEALDARYILDFGCGCGRISDPLARQFQQSTLIGCDVDFPCLRWCSQNLSSGYFLLSGSLPSVPFSDGRFDLVVALSVFTHLDKHRQVEWLRELRRVLSGTGCLLLTVHGKSTAEKLDKPSRRFLQSEGFLFEQSSKLRGIVPAWYHTAYHTEEMAVSLCRQHFQTVTYLPNGFGIQDLIVCRSELGAG